jgi:serine/threonine protein phosphatase 1
MENNTYCIADIHGELTKLKNCINEVNLKKGDKLIFLGDYVDRGPDSFGVIEHLIELSKKYECIFLWGNHDKCFYDGLTLGHQSLFTQGAKETVFSYLHGLKLDINIGYLLLEHLPQSHIEFFNNLKYYYIDEDNNCFVHGGFNRHYLINDENHNDGNEILIWDRDLIGQARSYTSMKNNEYPFKIKNNFKEIYLGHTPTFYFGSSKPLNFANIWLLDCGAAKFLDGKVCIMNIKTKKYYLN